MGGQGSPRTQGAQLSDGRKETIRDQSDRQRRRYPGVGGAQERGL